MANNPGSQMIYAYGGGVGYGPEAEAKWRAEQTLPVGTRKTIGGKSMTWDGHTWVDPNQAAAAPTNALAPAPGGYSLQSASGGGVFPNDPVKQQAYDQLLKQVPPGMPAAAWAEVVRTNLANKQTIGSMTSAPGTIGAMTSAPQRQTTDADIINTPTTYEGYDPNSPAQFTGVASGASRFPNDPRAAAAYDAELATLKNTYGGGGAKSGVLGGDRTMSEAEMSRLAYEAGQRKQQTPEMFDGVNDFLTNNVFGQAIAPVLQTGVGVTGGAAAGGGVAAHFGSGMPATPGPNPAGLGSTDPVIEQQRANNPSAPTPQIPSVIQGQFGGGVPSGNTIAPPSNSLGYNPIDVAGPDLGQQGPSPDDVGLAGPVLGTGVAGAAGALPTDAADPNNQPAPPAPTGGGTTTGDGTFTGTKDGGTTGTGTTGTSPTGTTDGGGNWWSDPSFWTQMAAAGLGGGLSMAAAERMATAQENAAQKQYDAMNNALALQGSQFNTQQENIKPWLDAGKGALTDLQNFDTNNPDFTFTNDDPSYTFRFDEGMKALQNSAAARGNLLSGNTMKGITDYGQQAASQEYQNAFNRAQTQRGQKLNRIQSLAGVGQTAVQQTNNAGQQYANNAGNLMTGGANAQAQGMTGAADARASGWMGMGNSFINGLNSYYANNQSQQMTNALMNMFGK